MRPQPKGAGTHNRIDAGLAPPSGFITAAVGLAMMPTAKRDGELIADLPPKRPALCEAQMMSVRRPPAANQASLFGNIFDVTPIAKPRKLPPRWPIHGGRPSSRIP